MIIAGKEHSNCRWDVLDKDRNFRFYEDLELNRTLTMFKYENLPKTIPELELEKILQINGYGIVTEYNGSLVALWGGLSSEDGCNLYYFPKGVRVDNPWARINKLYIIEDDEDAVLVRNDPLMKGMLPLLKKYSSEMVEADITLHRAMVNFRAMFVASGSSDREKDSFDQFFSNLEAGKISSIMEEYMSNGVKTQPYGSGSAGIMKEIVEAYQYIKGSYNNTIGLSDNVNMKRERLTEGEVEINEMTMRPLIDSMLEERQKAVAKINEKYGTNIKVSFNSSWSKYNEDYTEVEQVTTEEKQSTPVEVEAPSESVEETAVEPVVETESTETEVEPTETEEAPEEEPEVTVEVNVEVSVNSDEETEKEVVENEANDTEDISDTAD